LFGQEEKKNGEIFKMILTHSYNDYLFYAAHHHLPVIDTILSIAATAGVIS
jgi:hypothetical protein